MGALKNEDWFTAEQMNDLQWELLVKCLRHDLYWAKRIMKSYFKGRWYGRILSFLYWIFVKAIERKAKNIYALPQFPRRIKRVEARI